jgi:plasmid stabilization system protein ParE
MQEYKLSITELAEQDLHSAKAFYDEQAPHLGQFFVDALLVDLESLHFYAGIHLKEYSYYRMLAKRFPFAIYYDIENDTAVIHAVLDTRQNPLTTKKRLKSIT